jgi:gliding motility-associated-like protein
VAWPINTIDALKRIPLIVLTVLLLAFGCARVFAQGSTSNKGTEFWTCYMDHINGATGASASSMILYITSDLATTGTVSFADGTASIPFTVTPNAVTFVTIPSNQFLGTEGQFTKGIHITSVKAIAVYAHIYASAVSGATLLLPVNNIGKDYYSINYTQSSNSGTNNPSYSTFDIIATADSTTVEITPSALLKSGHVAGTPFTVILNKGQVYQGLSTIDLTGTHIRSISSATQSCKKIAVFSGSSKITIGCVDANTGTNNEATNASADNLFQQVYPTATWGKNFITVSLKARNSDIFRIVLSKPATNVTLNGTLVPLGSFTNGLYYQFNTNGISTNVISADQPIQVVQYTPSQNQALNNCTPKGVPEPAGDPEMIYLSPIEQGLDHVTLYSTGYFKILNSYINVVIPASAVSSFTLDGVPYGSSFNPVPNNTAYSFAQISVTTGPQSPSTVGTTAGTHNLKASQPFEAIAYGFGSAESYGYAAGTNLINLNEFVQLQNSAVTGIPPSTSGCTNVPYNLQLTLPYLTSQISWDLQNGNPPVIVNAPVPIATTVKGTQTLYTYQYAGTVNYATAGSYTVIATVFNPTSDGCGSNETIEFDFTISDLPAATFTKTDGCLGTPNVFTDTSDPKTSTIVSWNWDFGDGQTSVQQNPSHTYAQPGDYKVVLTVVNENGCSTTSAPQNVHISALPLASFTYTKPDCATQNITFTDQSTTAESTITSWAWNFGDGTAIQTKTSNAPFNYSYAKAGTYTVSLQVTTQSGCVSTAFTATVTVAALPVVDFGLPTVCLAGATAQFNDATVNNSGSPLTYKWDFGDTFATAANPNTSTVANPTHLFTAAGSYIVSLTITTVAGCITSVSKNYTVTGKASFTAPTAACPNDVVTFTDQTDPTKTAATAWSWDFGDGTALSVLQNPTHAYPKPGDYTVTLTVTGNNGCSTTSFNQAIHINKAPVAAFTYSMPDCETTALTFTDASTSAEGLINAWAWDFGDGSAVQTNTTNAPFNHVFAKAGTYNVKLSVTTVNGCTSVSTPQIIIVNPLPVVDFALPTVCLQNSTAQFTDKTTVANTTGTPFKYLWNFGDTNATAANPNAATIANPTHTFSAAGVYHISLTIVSNDGCTSTTVKDYNVSGIAKFTTASVACPNDMVSFTDQTDPSNKAATAWSWDFGDGTTVVSQQNPTHAFAKSGDYTVTLTVSGNNGCSITSYKQAIHITASPVANFIYSSPDCETRAVTFTDASTSAENPIATWIWDFGDGSGTQTNTTNAPVTHTFASAGTYTVNLQVVTASGCASALYPQTVVIHPLPVPDFILPDICTSQSQAQFTDKSTIADGSALTYLWSFGDPNATGSNPNTSTLQNPSHNYKAAQDYVLTLTVTSKDGCSVTKSATFTVNGDNPTAAFSLDPANTYCSSDNVVVLNGAQVNFGQITQIKMYWDYNGDQNNYTIYSKAQINAGGVFKMSHNYGLINTPGQTKNYTLAMVAYSGSSTACSSTSPAQSITIKNNPVINLSNIGTVCQESAPVQIIESKNGFTGTSVFSGPGISSTGLFDPSVSGPGTFTISYLFTAANSCTYSTSQQVIVNPTPKVNAGPDQHLLEGGIGPVLAATASGNAPLTYKWTMADGSKAIGLNRDDILNPVATPSFNAKYLLTVTSADGCTASSTVTVFVLKAPVVPNTFTPNGDGVNDTWNIKYIDTYPNCTVDVYNRLGIKLFSSVGYPVPWDGTYNGAVLPAATYYYIINPKNGRAVIAGSVTIIK